jgi:hypothetical protein
MRVRPLGSLALVGRAAGQGVVHVNPLDHKHSVLDLDLAFSRGDKVAATRIDSARLQRATQGPRQSTGGGRDYIVKGGRVWLVPRWCLVVLRDLVVHPEQNRRRLGRQKRLAQRALDPFNANL